MTPRRPLPLPGFLRALLAVALVLASFAHRPAFAAGAEGVSARVVFPDGSVAGNCLGEEGEAKGRVASAGCPYCRIGGAIVPPAPEETFLSCAVPPAGDIPPPARAAPPRQALLANAPLRGPPAVRG